VTKPVEMQRTFLTYRHDAATFFSLQLSDEKKCACVDAWKSTIKNRSNTPSSHNSTQTADRFSGHETAK
jgi:hypothetical protein